MNDTVSLSERVEQIVPTRSEIFRTFLRIGFLSFGGPAAQISLMHCILIEERKWLSEKQYLNALSAITAAVVEVILNLSIWFGLHVFFATVTAETYGLFKIWRPDLSTFDWKVLALSTLCSVLLIKFRLSIIKVLLVSSLAGYFLVEMI